MGFNVSMGGTHQPILLDVIKRTSGPILELGAGDSSTAQIHHHTTNDILTIEDNIDWYNRFLHLRTDRHKFLLLSELQMIDFFQTDTTQWGVVFVDSGSWVGRVAAIKRYKDTADYVIVHDTEYSAGVGYFGKVVGRNKRDFSDTFQFWEEYITRVRYGPATLLGSNKYRLSGKVIEGAYKLNESK